jgi:hypothetical protein
MGEDFLRRFQRGLGEHAHQIGNTQPGVDRPVPAPHRFAKTPRPPGMRVADHGVTGCDHHDRVAHQRGNTVGDRRDRSDDPEGGELGHSQPAIAADRFATEHFDPGHGRDQGEFLDLVGQSADLGFFKLERAEFLGLGAADFTNTLGRSFAGGDAAGGKLALGGPRRGDGRRDRTEHPILIGDGLRAGDRSRFRIRRSGDAGRRGAAGRDLALRGRRDVDPGQHVGCQRSHALSIDFSTRSHSALPAAQSRAPSVNVPAVRDNS